MLISKKNRIAIYSSLFKEGVIVAEKTQGHCNPRALINHPDIEGVPNLEVVKLMTSLTSKELVTERYAWKHYYWFLTDDGIEYLREYLHLPADMVPNTLKKSTRSTAPPGRGPPEGERSDRGRGPPRDDRGGYRGAGGEGGGFRGGGFGRGGGAPRGP